MHPGPIKELGFFCPWVRMGRMGPGAHGEGGGRMVEDHLAGALTGQRREVAVLVSVFNRIREWLPASNLQSRGPQPSKLTNRRAPKGCSGHLPRTRDLRLVEGPEGKRRREGQKKATHTCAPPPASRPSVTLPRSSLIPRQLAVGPEVGTRVVLGAALYSGKVVYNT
jgi:hypothetical protein